MQSKCNQSGGGKDWRERSEHLVVVPEDESEHPPYTLPRLSVVPPCSGTSSTDNLTNNMRRFTLTHADESMTVMVSAFYAKLLIVLGIAFPVTSTIQNELYTNITTDIFTIYLYTISLLYLASTFYHLRIRSRNKKNDKLKRTRYGSFYLHMGVAGFGVGSIIYSCLQFGEYFDLSGDCQLLIVALKPAVRILFMTAQTVFIFSYTDILDSMKGVVLDRFGLMHLLATNVCEWLSVVIQETRDDIITVTFDRPAHLKYANISHSNIITGSNEIVNATLTIQGLSYGDIHEHLTTFRFNQSNLSTIYKDWNCTVKNIITPLIRNINPYLRPCGVEYSLLCSVIIAVIWNDLFTVPGTKPKTRFVQSLAENECCGRVRSNNQFSVDCGSTHKGLFMGIAVLTGTIVSLMLFNGLFQNEKSVELALLQINMWETILFILMAIGSAACIQRMRTLTLRRTVTAMPLEHALLLITQCGVYLYYLFQIIGAGFLIQRYPEARRATRIIAPLCAVIQSSCQTLLVLDAWTRRCAGVGRRPGRQLVTFLLVGNFALWLLNRAKNARAEFHPLQMEFYGVWAWTLITHVSVPLLVCYRFQATVCFYEIWKNSYKKKKDGTDVEQDNVELKTV